MDVTLSNIKDTIIALAAFIGMGLGFYNLWSEKQKNKVKLEVIPKSVKDKEHHIDGQQLTLTTTNEFNINNSHGLYAFEVINHSGFNITVSEIGFLNSKGNDRASIPSPVIYDGGKSGVHILYGLTILHPKELILCGEHVNLELFNLSSSFVCGLQCFPYFFGTIIS